MAVTTQVPVEVYLRSFDFHPDAEYFDGAIQERPVGEDDHSAFQYAICAWFGQHQEQWNIRVRPELRVQIHSDKYLIPDVSILDAAYPREKIATIPPLAAFEVLSPENKLRDMLRKLDDYERMGILQIWVVDPTDPVWQRFQNGKLTDQDQFSLPERGIDFAMKEINQLVR